MGKFKELAMEQEVFEKKGKEINNPFLRLLFFICKDDPCINS